MKEGDASSGPPAARGAVGDSDTQQMDQVPLGWALGALVAPGLVIFVLPVLRLIAQNQEFFDGNYGAGRNIFLWGAAATLVGTALWFLRTTRVGRVAFYFFLLLPPAWVVYSLTAGLGRLGAASIVLVATLSGAVLLGWKARPLAMRQLATISTITVGALIFTTGLEMADTGPEADVVQAGNAGTGEPREDLPNVYHIVLDMFQTDLFEPQLDGDLEAQLGGFTMYPENIVEFGRTHMSMASIYAGQDWDYETPAPKWMTESTHGEGSALTQLADAGYQTTGWIESPRLYGGESPFDITNLPEDLDTSSLPTDELKLAQTLWVFSNLPGQASERLLDADDYAMLEDNVLLPASAPATAPLTMAAATRAEADLEAHGRYTLIHIFVPHVPFVLTSDCTEVAMTTASEQSACAVLMVEDFLDELKSLDRYDDSTIVVQADHGGYFQLVDGEVIELPDERESTEWNEARSRALLLVKPAGAPETEPFRTVDYPSVITDVLPTIFDSVGLTVKGPDDRTSLLADQLPDRPVRYFNFYKATVFGNPDGEIRRYAVTEDGVTLDQVIEP